MPASSLLMCVMMRVTGFSPVTSRTVKWGPKSEKTKPMAPCLLIYIGGVDFGIDDSIVACVCGRIWMNDIHPAHRGGPFEVIPVPPFPSNDVRTLMSAAMKAMERAWQNSFQRSSSWRVCPVKTTTLCAPTTASVSAPWCTLRDLWWVGVGVGRMNERVGNACCYVQPNTHTDVYARAG